MHYTTPQTTHNALSYSNTDATIPTPTYQLRLEDGEVRSTKGPRDMLYIIAMALQAPITLYTERNRKRDVVDLRFLSAYLLRSYYPHITYKQIAALYGGQDHTSVMHAIQAAANLLHTHDEVFTHKFYTALHSVQQWVNEP
jgi:chromosomal replication initiation ATPase DnaA